MREVGFDEEFGRVLEADVGENVPTAPLRLHITAGRRALLSHVFPVLS
jgi:hypothetical protein